MIEAELGEVSRNILWFAIGVILGWLFRSVMRDE